jgi:glycine cleavage system H lipoate-binding protein
MSLNDPYTIKALEYLLGLAFLVFFVGFWQYVNGAGAVALERARALCGPLADFFRLPADLFFHPGHAWVRSDGSDVITVGVDDFAQQLVGPLSAVNLPRVGAALDAGSRAWSVEADAKRIDMLAPVTGTVIAVNDALSGRPGLVNDDPYGGGWLARMRVPRSSKILHGLMSGQAARAWMDKVSSELTAVTPELGQVSQDGGVPIHGLARAISEDRWDDVARKFLQSDESPEPTDPVAGERS